MLFLMVLVFQSTLRRTERRIWSSLNVCSSKFQSTLRRTERRTFFYSTHKSIVFQSTLRRTERLYRHLQVGLMKRISIHAPTNGATFSLLPPILLLIISIHAPTNGATYTLALLPTTQPFQSTLRRTERQDQLLRSLLSDNFNPRSDERSD